MMGHKICFYGEIWLIIPKLSVLPFLIWTTAADDTGRKVGNSTHNQHISLGLIYIMDLNEDPKIFPKILSQTCPY